MNNKKKVKDLIIAEGVSYSGFVKFNKYQDEPNGMGVINDKKHKKIGKFKNGILNGWGIDFNYNHIEHQLSFGVFQDNVLKVNLAPLVGIFWSRLFELANSKSIPIDILDNGDIFIGVYQTSFFGKYGFYFTDKGEVYLGVYDLDQEGLTGKFLHFDIDYNLTIGEYQEGALIRKISRRDFEDTCKVWVNYYYLDFDINMNYNPVKFFNLGIFSYQITKIASTNKNLYVKTFDWQIYDTSDDSKAIWFIYPVNREDIKNELVDIARNKLQFSPSFSDYRIEFINDLGDVNTRHLVVYSHITNWEKDPIFDEIDIYKTDDENKYDEEETERDIMLRLIPDFYVKEEQLSSQWRNGGWYYSFPSLRDYVKSLAYDEDVPNFFGWLFNDSRYNNCSIWSLPYEYEIALEQFLYLFPDLDDY